MKTIKKSEPAVGIGATISAIMFAVIGILKANGVVITDDLATHIDALIYALCAIPAVSGFLTRFFVYAPETVEQVKVEEFAAGQASITDPAEPPRSRFENANIASPRGSGMQL